MLPPTHPLIEAATEPLADNAEQQLAARALLEETFDAGHPDISETLIRFGEADAAKHPTLWKWLLPALAGIAILGLGIAFAPKVRALIAIQSYLGSLYMDPLAPTLPEGLSREQALLLGDPEKTLLQQREELYLSAPDRPDFYSDYLVAYISRFQRLPNDHFEIAARIDPDNAYFLYIGAALTGKDAVERESRTNAQRDNNEPIRYTIKDEEAMRDTLEIFRKARSLPRYDTYVAPMFAARVPLLKQGNIVERINAIAYVAGQPAASIQIRHLSNIVAAEAGEIAKESDKAKLTELMKDNEHFLEVCASSPVGSLVDELVFNICVHATTEALSEAATELGIVNERLEQRKQRVIARKEWRKGKRGDDEVDAITTKAGALHGLVMPMVSRQVQNPIPITDAELRPGRLLDHEIASQILTALSCLVMLFAASAAFLFRFRAPYHARITADRISLLLGKGDWAWILGIGVVLPFALIILVNRGTPLGGREYGLKGMGMLFPLLHFVLLVLSLLTMPLLILRARLGRRIEPFGIATRSSALAWVIPALGLICAFIAYPVASKAGISESIFYAIMATPAAWLLAMLISAARALFGKRELRVSRAAASVALIPTYSLAIILLASLYPILAISERKLTEEDPILKLDPESPGMTPYEYKITVQLRKEINAILGN